MVDNSKARVGSALEEESFVDKMDALSEKARGSDYLMENLGSYISQICEAAATHHVLMNQSFVSAALAIKVQEGIVLCKFISSTCRCADAPICSFFVPCHLLLFAIVLLTDTLQLCLQHWIRTWRFGR